MLSKDMNKSLVARGPRYIELGLFTLYV